MLNKGSSSRPLRFPAPAEPTQTPGPDDPSGYAHGMGIHSAAVGGTRDPSRDTYAAARPIPHAGRAASSRLLIPVDATDRSRWALQYALALHRDRPVEVELLFVTEPVARLEVLRFRTQQEIAEFQAKVAHYLLQDAAEPLRAAGIPVRSHMREGVMPSQIVEAAEQLGCGQIVLPSPPPRLLDPLSRGLARAVRRRAQSVPVITVNRNGFLVPW